MSNDRCVTNLLPDEPTAQDIFGPHARIAAAIANLITTESTGKSVAVTGAWGSGKSSVLRMLQKELSETADVFIFDAWAHEGDPLRRSFLERLIDFLSREHPDAKLDSLKDKLFLRAKTQEVTTQPVLTWAAKVLGLALLLVPPGIAVSSLAVRMPNPTGGWFWTGLGMVISPVLILLTLLLGTAMRTVALKINTLKRKLVIGGFTLAAVFIGILRFQSIVLFAKSASAHPIISCAVITTLLVSLALAMFRHSSKLSEVLPLLLNKTVATTRTESIEPIDPSSTEFQRFFAEILKMRGKAADKKLVIAIDNLDRVDPDLALRLWSTMRTFFEFDFETSPASSTVWLLATFDIQALHRLWPTEGSNGSSPAEQFVNKTFQVSFSVPPLVLINRGDYLRSQLTKAFLRHRVDEFNAIVQLYDLKHMGELSTPRDVTKFVNAVGSLHRQWNDQISLIHLALYIIVSEGQSDTFGILASVNSPVVFPREIIGEDFEEALAAIHFNVARSKAAHVLLSNPLNMSLASGDHQKLAELSKISGFDRVLEDVVIRNRQNWIQHGTGSLANAILALDSLGLYDRNQSVKNVWDWLTRSAMQVSKWSPIDKLSGQAIALLIKRATSKETIDTLLNSAGRSLPLSTPNIVDNSEAALRKYIEDLKPVLELLPTLATGVEFNVDGIGLDFVNLLEAVNAVFKRHSVPIASRLNTPAKAGVIGGLAARAKSLQLAPGSPEIIRFLTNSKFDFEWRPMFEAVAELFRNTGNNFAQAGFQTVLESLLVLLNTQPQAASEIQRIAMSGMLHHILALAGFAETKYGADALLGLLLFLDSEPSALPGQAQDGLRFFSSWKASPAGSVTANLQLAKVAIEFEQVDRLQKRAESVKELKPAISIVLEIINRLDGESN